jgi:hypothetical protein
MNVTITILTDFMSNVDILFSIYCHFNAISSFEILQGQTLKSLGVNPVNGGGDADSSMYFKWNSPVPAIK